MILLKLASTKLRAIQYLPMSFGKRNPPDGTLEAALDLVSSTPGRWLLSLAKLFIVAEAPKKESAALYALPAAAAACDIVEPAMPVDCRVLRNAPTGELPEKLLSMLEAVLNPCRAL